ncbi:hypothetical protein [Mitsuaria sp. GD03876]|uniref:hypothetical protein n=1 Tax=Mitsuaria sp. GD03876 TaxID=2975399 RepID=UPI00244B0777|nr:hypothetical protein [Mitsuaria sp. GD03876]MDH0865907.1 hypothetical protein [Mitsuaria sp. GD03876]
MKISHELDSLCDELQRRDVGRCGAVSWQGKHRWFGKVDLAGRFGPPPQTRVEAVIAELGWAPAENGDANTFEHAGMRLSLYLHVGSVHAIHVTTRI